MDNTESAKRARKYGWKSGGLKLRPLQSSRKRSSSSSIEFAGALLAIAALLFSIGITPPPVFASAPSAGGISPTGPTLNWNGTAVGTGAANETVCQEGVNCDTYTLTIAPN